MDDKLNKSTDKLVQKAMEHVELPKPSDNFTANLMSKIEVLITKKSLFFKPLINKKTGIIVAFIIFSLVIASFFITDINNSSFLDIEKIKTVIKPKYILPNTVTNSILMIGLLLLIQLVVLKNYFSTKAHK